MLLKRYKFVGLTFLILCVALVTFWLTDFSYTIYGVSVDGEEAPANIPLVAEYQSDKDYGAVVLMYHHIVTDEDYATNKYAGNNAVISVSQFREEMEYLSNNGYTTFLMSEVAGIMYNSLPFPTKSVIITFDDGYASNYTYAYPILKEYNLKATVAAVVSSSETASQDGDVLQNIPHLTFAQMREMQDSGLIEFGSHSYDGHGLISTNNYGGTGKYFVSRQYLSSEGRVETEDEYKDRISQDLRYSKYVLETELDNNVIYFAYPYGVSDANVQSALKQNGFLMATTTVKGSIKNSSNALKLNRRNVDQDITLEQFIALVNSR